MYPKLVTLPGGITITTYGFCLMIGFLSAVYLAMKRAERVHVDADRVLDASFFALIFGVGGARVMYVMHYWRTDFADSSNHLLAIIDIRQGGLEFIGGLIGASIAVLIYLKLTKQSIRLYLDILAPSTMWGLAFGRLGCFFNGCCFGGLCVLPGTVDGATALATQFPYGSPAHVRQWENRQVTLPAELISTRGLLGRPIPPGGFKMSVEERSAIIKQYKSTTKALSDAKTSGADATRIRQLDMENKAARKTLEVKHLGDLLAARKFPSRREPSRATSVSELEALAETSRSRPVHPTQLYSSVNALLFSAFLTTVFYRRKRHGVVIGLMFLLYPIARVMLEIIRADNPHDVGGLTISQSLSAASVVLASVYLFILYKYCPERSPVADRALARPEPSEE